MASDLSFVEFIADQMKEAGAITFRKMFGEYALYCDGKVIALICDDQLFVKPTDAGRKFIRDVVEAPAYPGAKPSFLIEDKFEDREWISDLARITAKGLAAPRQKFSIPKIIVPGKVRIIMVCEAMPEAPGDYFYSSKSSLYVVNTIDSFNNAGIRVETMEDIVRKGVYLTVAVKSPRKGLTVPVSKIESDSYVLEEELKAFPRVKAILLMGDAAIKAMNFISKRTNKTKVIPSGSTYKIRKGEFYFGDIRVFPSYLQTGKNFLIEKSKRRMVAEDIRNAFNV